MTLAYANGVYGVVALAPTPATTGTSITLSADTSSLFPDPAAVGNYPISIWPTGSVYLGGAVANHGEICTVTAKSGSTLTVVRGAEGSTARAIVVGDQVQMAPTADTFNNLKVLTLTVKGTDPLSAIDGLILNINHYDGVTPISAEGATVKISRYELFTVASANPVSSQYNAALLVETASGTGNKNQPVALGINSIGYSEGGLFNLGFDIQVQQNSGANVGGNYGGAMAGYANVHGYFDHGGIFGYGTDCYNGQGIDGTSASGGQAAFDISLGGDGNYSASVTCTSASPGVVTWTGYTFSSGGVIRFTSGTAPTGTALNTDYWITSTGANTFKLSTSYANYLAGTFVNTSSTGSGLIANFYARFGSGIQFRINSGANGADTGINFIGGGTWINGMDFSGGVYRNAIILFGPGPFGVFYIGGNTTAPAIAWDNNDYLTYHTTDNTYHSVIGGSDSLFWGTGVLGFIGLPTSSPGAGTKQFWVDGSGFVHWAT
jgi:hypothetical protein